MKKTTPDAPAPMAKIRSQRARPTTVLGRTKVRKSPLLSGLGSRGWPIGAVYSRRKPWRRATFGGKLARRWLPWVGVQQAPWRGEVRRIAVLRKQRGAELLATPPG